LVKEKGVVVSLLPGVLVGGTLKAVDFTTVFKIWAGLGFDFSSGDLGIAFDVAFTPVGAVLPRAAETRVCVGMVLHTNERVVSGSFLRICARM
jgi:hypothetical protein